MSGDFTPIHASSSMEAIEPMLQKLSYVSLNPMQAEAVMQGILDAPRSLVCAPTASGKTLLAILRILRNFEGTKGKAVYLVPLKALAQEKHREFSQAFLAFGLKVAISSSDFDSSSEELAAADVIIATNEKFDSLLRHNSGWIKKVNLAIVDEVHLLHDGSRGSTLEIVFVKLMDLGAQLLALSATVANAEELASWLNAKLFQSCYRPTKLVYGIATGSRLVTIDPQEMQEKTERLEGKVPLGNLLKRCLASGGQALVFVSSRRGAEAAARDLSPLVGELVSSADRVILADVSQRALKALPNPTSQCRLLSSCLAQGIAFHHAGIVSKQRSIIEEGFKQSRCLKVIVATPTLAMGVDFPASYVIIRDLKRFTGAFAEFLPRFEVAQMAGRSGRPRYDKEGFAVLLCQPDEINYVRDEYVFGALEKIESKLSSAAVLRMHTLGLIASGYCKSFSSLYEFFQKSLFAFQYGSTTELLQMVEQAVFELKDMEFVSERSSGNLLPTPLGKRVSELYIDPLSANAFVEFIRSKGEKSELDYLLTLQCATEMLPLPHLRREEEQRLFDEVDVLKMSPFLEKQFDDYNFLSKYKAAKILKYWIGEETEETILETFGVAPGLLASHLRNAVWLCYALQELAFLLNATSTYAQAKRMRRRLRHGIKEELLPICTVKGIGRVRGRKLFNAGIRTADDLRSRSREEIRRILRS